MDQTRFNAFLHFVVNLPTNVKIETHDKGKQFRIEVDAGPAQRIVLELTNVRDTQVREHVGTVTEGDEGERANGTKVKAPAKKRA